MLYQYGEDVDGMNSTSAAATELGRLASDLGFTTEEDSAAVLSALLDHYKREESKSSENSISVLVDENVSSTDVVCVVALNTATEWLSQSAERADALFQYESFMNQVNEWTGGYKGERHLSPYVSGLQVLLRMCMNSERPAKVRSLADCLKHWFAVLVQCRGRGYCSTESLWRAPLLTLH